MKIILALILNLFLFLTSSYARECDIPICNNYIVCDEKAATFTRTQFSDWLKTDVSKYGYTVEWTSSSNAWIIYNENCRAKERCFDEQGECVLTPIP